MSAVAVAVKWGKYQEIVQIDLDGLRNRDRKVTRTTETDGKSGNSYQWKTTNQMQWTCQKCHAFCLRKSRATFATPLI
jgi:hypothetical protein